MAEGNFCVSRRTLLNASVAALVAAGLPRRLGAAEVTVLDDPADLSYAYVERASGRVVLAKSFFEVHPELKVRERAFTPYRAPIRPVYLGALSTLVQEDAVRYGIIDVAERKASGDYNYRPAEYTHHFLLILGDREMAREELGAWALAHANEEQKARALDVLHRQHSGYNGGYVTGDPAKMAEAVRFYTGRELLRPVLFLGPVPAVGDLAVMPGNPIRLAASGTTDLAAASGAAIKGGISIGVSSTMAQAVGVAAQGATVGVGAPGGAIGQTAGSGASAGRGSSSGGTGTGTGSTGTGGTGGNGGGNDGAFVPTWAPTYAEVTYGNMYCAVFS